MTTEQKEELDNAVNKFYRNSEEELACGQPLTHDHLQDFINSPVIGWKVKDLVAYYESKIEEAEKKQQQKFIEFVNTQAGLFGTQFNFRKFHNNFSKFLNSENK